MTKITDPYHLHLESEAETKRLAQAFARHMQVADVVLLNGGLAAGKTFFVSAAVAALTSSDTVSSPTYTLANIYATPKGPVLHMDAYRLESASDFHDLALEDQFERGLAFIEWGDMLAGQFDTYVALELSLVPNREFARTASLTAFGPRGTALLADILKGFAA